MKARSTRLAVRMGQRIGILLLALLAAPPLHAQTIIETPGTSGDQLIFFYDAREGRVPFIAVGSFADTAVVVETAIYNRVGSAGTGGLAFLTSEVATIPARGALPTIDPTDAIRFPGMNGTAGLVVVTAVVAEGDTRPVVSPTPGGDPAAGSLFGGFTLANLNLNSGFGQNPFARVAVDGAGQRAAPGTVVDGTVVRYQTFAPDVLAVPFYFNPKNLGPPENDGNRIILGAFADVYGADNFRIGSLGAAMQFDYIMEDAAGVTLVDTDQDIQVVNPVPVNGVHFDNLENLAGPLTLSGPGKVTFVTVNPVPAVTNLFGIVSQSVGTFSIGQRMPGGQTTAPTTNQTGNGSVPCNAALGIDIWSFPVTSGENITITVDTVSAETTGDLRILTACTSTNSGIENRSEFRNDEVACTFAPPAGSCPQDQFSLPANSVCTVGVAVANNDCAGTRAAYTLTVTPARTLTLTGDEFPPA